MCSGEGQGGFRQSLSNPCILRDKTPESSHDVSKLVVVGESGTDVESNYSDAYSHPDIRFPRWMLAPSEDDCSGHFGRGSCTGDDCGNADVANACTPINTCYGGDARLVRDPTYRKTFARHLGGDNLGFADGHATWMPADTILLGGADHTRQGIHPQVYYGMCVCVNLTAVSRWDLPEWDDPTYGNY